jgi:RNA polymerase sigma-70 factor (ECF subfamily)
MVLAAGKPEGSAAREALAELCGNYWYPIYAYVRRRTAGPEAAQDLTQAFFAHLLEQHALAKADRDRGRFRAFLLTAVKNFLANEGDKARAAKRGGGQRLLSLDFDDGEARWQREPSHEITPEKLFERRFVLTLIEQVLDLLRRDCEQAGRAEHYAEFQAALGGDAAAVDYEGAGRRLGISAAAAKQAAYRLRKRYRELFRAEVERTVADAREVDDEIGRLLAILGE